MNDAKQKILIVDDEAINLKILGDFLSTEYRVVVATDGEKALKLLREQSDKPDLIILDVIMPSLSGIEVCRQLKCDPEYQEIPILFASTLETVEDKVACFNAGAVDFITKPLQCEEILARVQTHLTLRNQYLSLNQKNEELQQLNQQLQQEIELRQSTQKSLQIADEKLQAVSQAEAKKWGVSSFIGNNSKTLEMLDEIRTVQKAGRTNILILGESGSGKELVARAVHYGSSRSSKPFITINCSTIPHELADAAFFGSVKGAYTGSIESRTGYFQEADGGTLFLDEIGDMPFALQTKLLRVLENGEYTPVGSHKVRFCDVRIVSATNVNLDEGIAEKRFRQDLYFRLAGFVIQLPSLKERGEDIALLANHFLHLFAEEMGYHSISISPEALNVLQNYSFPGNVRELKNMVEYALIRSGGLEILPQHFPIKEATYPSFVRDSSKRGLVTDTLNDEDKILNYLQNSGRINNRECQTLLNVDHQKASYLLKKMYRDGVLQKQGERRWSYYRLPL